jgi:hypothetical protein
MLNHTTISGQKVTITLVIIRSNFAAIVLEWLRCGMKKILLAGTHFKMQLKFIVSVYKV